MQGSTPSVIGAIIKVGVILAAQLPIRQEHCLFNLAGKSGILNILSVFSSVKIYDLNTRAYRLIRIYIIPKEYWRILCLNNWRISPQTNHRLNYFTDAIFKVK